LLCNIQGLLRYIISSLNIAYPVYKRTYILCPISIHVPQSTNQNFSSDTGRVRTGIPAAWNTVRRWLNSKITAKFTTPPAPSVPNKKCPDIPTLSSYMLPPPPDFWKIFPIKKLPSHPSSVINYVRLGSIIKKYRSSLSMGQNIRANRVIQDLKHGSPVPFLSALPSARINNSTSVTVHGEEFTDTLAWWIRQGYVAGPFIAPPPTGIQVQFYDGSSPTEQDKDYNGPQLAGWIVLQ
jgi:hypothetical protein